VCSAGDESGGTPIPADDDGNGHRRLRGWNPVPLQNRKRHCRRSARGGQSEKAKAAAAAFYTNPHGDAKLIRKHFVEVSLWPSTNLKSPIA
jgi:hypothetical protein